MITSVQIGDRVRYESAAGTIRGEITRMFLGLNALNQLVPWLMIEHYNGQGRLTSSSLCGTEEHLNMMQFKVTFRTK